MFAILQVSLEMQRKLEVGSGSTRQEYKKDLRDKATLRHNRLPGARVNRDPVRANETKQLALGLTNELYARCDLLSLKINHRKLFSALDKSLLFLTQTQALR